MWLTVEHSRVRLGTSSNVSNSDYINANTIVRYTALTAAFVACFVNDKDLLIGLCRSLATIVWLR